MFRFVKGMIAFRKSRQMLGRSRFWREDIRWYGASGNVDMSEQSRSLAWHLSGRSFDEPDLYVMINAREQPLRFHIQEGPAANWLRVLDTSLDPPQDIADPGQESALSSLEYNVAPWSIVVLSSSHTI